MDALARILVGLLMVAVGFLMAARTNIFLDLLGPVDWAERTFISGGSRVFYKLLGTAIIIIGFIVITNLFDILIGGFVASVFSV